MKVLNNIKYHSLRVFCLVTGASVLVFDACCLFNQQGNPIPFDQSYAILNEKLDGGYYLTTSKILNFIYAEEYKVSASNNKLTYNIYDRLHNTSLGVDENSVPIVAGSPLETVVFGENRYKIDLSAFSLVSGNYYVLEVVNDKKEKQYLRFKLD